MLLACDPRPPENRHYHVTAEDFIRYQVFLVADGPANGIGPLRYEVTQDEHGNLLEARVIDLHTHFELRPKVGVVCPA